MTASPSAPFIDLGNGVEAHPGLAQLLTDIHALSPHPSNPRNGDTDAIGESVRVNKVYRPVMVQRSTGFVLAGNHTYATLMEQGASKIPVVWLDVDDTDAVRIMAADNRTADLGRYDDALLVQLLTELGQSDAALLGTGYAEDDLEEMAASLARAEAAALKPFHYATTESDGADVMAPTLAEQRERYEQKGVRYVLLEYSNATYVEVVEALNAYRAEHALESNADAVLSLLGLPVQRLTPAEATQ